MTLRSLPLLVLCAALFACKLLKPSPEKQCAKVEKLYNEDGKQAPKTDKCIALLTTMKEAEPARYECNSQCVKTSSTRLEFSECARLCDGGNASANARLSTG